MGYYGVAYCDNDVFSDVKASMDALLESGISASLATASVLDEYVFELDDEDDAAYVYMAIAAAQLEHGKMLKKTKATALEYIDIKVAQLMKDNENKEFALPHIESLNAFKEQLVLGQKPVKVKRVPVKCRWNIGDTYAKILGGPESEELGLDGYFLLLRMIDKIVVGNNVYPYVYMSITPQKCLPQTAQEVAKAKYLRCDFRRTYRTALFYDSDEALDKSNLIYVGCFPDVPAPEAEVVLKGMALEYCFCRFRLLDIVHEACNSYRTYGF